MSTTVNMSDVEIFFAITCPPIITYFLIIVFIFRPSQTNNNPGAKGFMGVVPS